MQAAMAVDGEEVCDVAVPCRVNPVADAADGAGARGGGRLAIAMLAQPASVRGGVGSTSVVTRDRHVATHAGGNSVALRLV